MASTDALLLGDNWFPFHELDELSPSITEALGDDASVTVEEDRDALLDLADGEYDVFVDYRTDSSMTDEQEAALLQFVESGGGYLGIHCATDLTSTHDGDGGIDGLDEPIPSMRDVLGGHFLNHPEQGTFGVRVDGDHPVIEGVSDFEVYDEPYMIEHDPEAVDVLATMDHPSEDMDDYAVVWVREYGDGRVAYSSLGHTVEALEHDSHRRILQNGLAWVAEA